VGGSWHAYHTYDEGHAANDITLASSRFAFAGVSIDPHSSTFGRWYGVSIQFDEVVREGETRTLHVPPSA